MHRTLEIHMLAQVEFADTPLAIEKKQYTPLALPWVFFIEANHTQL